jgi:hypothetical protein
MKGKKIIGLLLSMMFLLALAGNGAAREPYPVGGSEGKKKEGPAITAKGTVKHLGGQFYLVSPEVKDSLLIMNPDAKLLDDLSKSGRTVTIQGRLPMGADALFINKIDGKPFPGRKGTPYPAGKGTPGK